MEIDTQVMQVLNIIERKMNTFERNKINCQHKLMRSFRYDSHANLITIEKNTNKYTKINKIEPLDCVKKKTTTNLNKTMWTWVQLRSAAGKYILVSM